MRLLLTLLMFLVASQMLAQSRELTGVLTTRNGDAIPGCSVFIKGTTATAGYTQLCGEFSISIPENYDGTLVFSCLAPRNWEIPVRKLKDINKPIITLRDWYKFENGSCQKNFRNEKRIKIR